MDAKMKKSANLPNAQLILTCFITCFGSSLLYGYNIAVFNGPKLHIECFLGEKLLDISPCPHYAHPLDAKNSASSFDSNKTTANPMTTVRNVSRLYNATELAANLNRDSHRIAFYYSLLMTVWIVFGALGAFCTGAISNFFGRRNGLLFNNAFAIAGAAIGAPAVAAGSPALLYAGRAFAGFNSGVTIGLASIYLTEIAPVSARGAIGACHQLAVTVGILVAFLSSGLEQTLNRPNLWIIAHAITGIPALLSMAILPLCPESPRFLCINRANPAAAAAAIRRFFPGEDADRQVDEILAEAAPLTNQGGRFSFCQLFTSAELRLPVALAVCVQIMQQLSGINAVMSYSTAMMSTCGIPSAAVPYVNLGFSAFNILCTLASLPLLERLGRRSLLLWPTAILGGSLVVLCVSAALVKKPDGSAELKQVASVLFVVFIFVYTAGFAFGLGTIPGFIVAELFRQEPRSSAYSLSQGVQFLSNLLVATSFVNLQLALDGYVFLLYLGVVAPLWIFFYSFMPETKGRSFDAVANDLAFPEVCRRAGRRHVTKTVVIDDAFASPALLMAEPSNGNGKTQQC